MKKEKEDHFQLLFDEENGVVCMELGKNVARYETLYSENGSDFRMLFDYKKRLVAIEVAIKVRAYKTTFTLGKRLAIIILKHYFDEKRQQERRFLLPILGATKIKKLENGKVLKFHKWKKIKI